MAFSSKKRDKNTGLVQGYKPTFAGSLQEQLPIMQFSNLFDNVKDLIKILKKEKKNIQKNLRANKIISLHTSNLQGRLEEISQIIVGLERGICKCEKPKTITRGNNVVTCKFCKKLIYQ